MAEAARQLPRLQRRQPDVGQPTYDQGRVLDLVLAVWVGAVLEQEGGVLHQTSRCCQEERRLTQRGALLHRLGA